MKTWNIKDLDNWLSKMADLKSKIDALDDERKSLSDEKEKYEHEFLKYMIETGKTSYVGSGAKVELRTSLSFKTPKDDESKRKFFDYLKKKGEEVFFGLVSVNSQTLNAFCKREYELAKEENIFPFKVDGIEDPISYNKVVFKKL